MRGAVPGALCNVEPLLLHEGLADLSTTERVLVCNMTREYRQVVQNMSEVYLFFAVHHSRRS